MEGKQQHPKREGVSGVETILNADGTLRKHELQLGQAKSLAELAETYAFFTPAVLYLHGRFIDTPLSDFVFMVHQDAKFYFKKFNRAIFRGLETRSNGNTDWNFALWAIQKEYWESFSNWMVSLTLTYSDTGSVAGIGEQQFTILDPLAIDRISVFHSGLPTIQIHAFGLNGDKFRAGFVVGNNPLLEPPVLRFLSPDSTMKAFSQALYSGHNPLNARAVHKQKLSSEENNHEG